MARIVAPGYPHHITQPGNRRQRTFFNESDYSAYIDLMAEWCERCGVEIWGYCLMPNHTHLIARPEKIDSLSSAIGEAHRRYSRMINFREGWRGYLWQGRFSSFVMDEAHLIASIRYIERNPVRAKLVTDPGDYKWSSYNAHLTGKNDKLVKVGPLLQIVHSWKEFVEMPALEVEAESIRMPYDSK
ncbi:transposase [Desulfobacula sp.]|uniref:transposase n=1 Tax=Desulfobacula sp. TaxID=2593537 RepID=UPI0039B8B7D5